MLKYANCIVFPTFLCATFHLAYLCKYEYAHAIGNTGSHIRPFTNDLKRGSHMSINVLPTLVEQYKEAAQLIESAQAEQLKIQIREALAERSTNYLEVGCHKVRLSDFSSTRLDSKAIKAVTSTAKQSPASA